MRTQLHAAIFIALSTVTATAQTLTDANSIPPVGHAELRTFHTSSVASGWALTGTGNTWDATAVTPQDLSALVTYRAPATSPFAATYPTTTLCAERVPNGSTPEWRHYVVNATQAEMIGVSTEAVVGGRTYCTFPFLLSNSFSDSWTINGNNLSDTYTYVASGSVQAPWGTIPDVVMFETSGGFSYYLYMASNVLDPIGTYTPGFGLDLWKVELATGIDEATAPEVGLWPNPATDQLALTLPGQPGFSYTLFNAEGRAMLNGTSTNDRAVVDLRGCAPGVYSVLVTDPRGRRAVSKVVVVR